MSDLVVIVPSRGRPGAVPELAEAFRVTCEADVELAFAVDADDPCLPEYRQARADEGLHWLDVMAITDSTSMVQELNRVAVFYAQNSPAKAIAFMGDDHRPRTYGWDAAYLAALQARPGLVYGNDLLQGERLPTQAAMSAAVVRALGHMAPPVLHHLYVDNYWLALGQAAGCITYLPDVVVEHMHPVARKASWDEGYQRVNAPDVYERDEQAYTRYWAEHGARDVQAVREALAAVPS